MRMQISSVLLLLALGPVYTQFISPCPKLFKYDSTRQLGQWNGTVTLLSKAELYGVWLVLTFDKPVLQLGNYFGEIKRRDGNNILIKRRDFKVLANKPYGIKIIVNYDVNETPPLLVSFRLNGITLCPEGGVTEGPPSSGQLITSSIFSPTDRPPIPENTAFSRPPESYVTCGTVPIPPAPLISHGQKTAPGQWPWHAALYHVHGAQIHYVCGATLVSKNHLLTAAHCVTKPRTNRPTNAKSLLVFFGKYSLTKFENVQDGEVSQIFIHPSYNYTVFFNDIAVLKLKDPVDVTNYVRPCCLWEGNDGTERLINRLGTVVGWGFNEKHVISDTLMQTQMPVVEKTKCIYSNPNFFSVFTNENNFCAGFRNGTTVCNGDSGGGMVFPKPGTYGRNTVWQIKGIVSVSVVLQHQTICDPDHYAIFTDVGRYLGWIKRILYK